MKAFLGLLLLIALTTLFSSVFAETVYVSGDASGVWTADSIVVIGQVRIPPDQTLIINPGVKVLFWTYCQFIIDNNAVLKAIGTEQDSILFDEYFPGNHWNGLRFLYASDSCRIEYCHLTNGYASGEGDDAFGGALYFNSCSTTVAHSTIDYCGAEVNGGAIYCYNSSPDIWWNNLSNNTSSFDGGAIYCSLSNPYIKGNTIESNSASGGGGIGCFNYSTPLISENIITGNTGAYGGGFYLDFSNPSIIGNTISGNTGWYGGGGINCTSNSNADIIGNTINGNTTWSGGGGIYCYSSSPFISENTIEGNTSWGGGGIYCANASPTISENTLRENTAGVGGGIHCESDSHPDIVSNKINSNNADDSGGGIYCNSYPDLLAYNEICSNSAVNNGGGVYLTGVSFTMYNNTIVINTATSGRGLYSTDASHPVVINCIIWDALPDMAPQITQNNNSSTLITYSDISQLWPGIGNINADPLFISSANGDYRLLLGSPCIDTGDPNSIYDDPDGTRNDMGCYYYQHVGIERPESTTAPSEYVLYPAFPNPFNSATSIVFDLPKSSSVSLFVYDVRGCQVAELVDGFKSAGSHQVVFDASRLSSGVYFAVLQAGNYIKTQKMLFVK